MCARAGVCDLARRPAACACNFILHIHAALGHAARARAQLMPMTATGESFSKYAAVLFFMGACISWCANINPTLAHAGAPVPSPLELCIVAGAGRSLGRRARRCRPQHVHRGQSLSAASSDTCAAGRSGTNNSAIFSEIVPEQLRSAIYAFDRSFEGAVGATAAPLVGARGPRAAPARGCPRPVAPAGTRAVGCVYSSLHVVHVWAGLTEAAMQVISSRRVTARPAVCTGSAAQGALGAPACRRSPPSHALPKCARRAGRRHHRGQGVRLPRRGRPRVQRGAAGGQRQRAGQQPHGRPGRPLAALLLCLLPCVPTLAHALTLTLDRSPWVTAEWELACVPEHERDA